MLINDAKTCRVSDHLEAVRAGEACRIARIDRLNITALQQGVLFRMNGLAHVQSFAMLIFHAFTGNIDAVRSPVRAPVIAASDDAVNVVDQNTSDLAAWTSTTLRKNVGYLHKGIVKTGAH